MQPGVPEQWGALQAAAGAGVPEAAGHSLCSWGTLRLPQLPKSGCPGSHVNHPVKSRAFPGRSAGSEAHPKGPTRPRKTLAGQSRTDPTAVQGSVLPGAHGCARELGGGDQPGLGVPFPGHGRVALVLSQRVSVISRGARRLCDAEVHLGPAQGSRFPHREKHRDQRGEEWR